MAKVTDTRLLQRGVQVPRRQARADRRGSVPGAAHRLRRRGRLRDPLPGRARRARCGTRCWRPARSTGCGRSASSPSGSCACRRCTSSSARTPTRSRRPFGAAMPWIVKLDKEQDFIGKWALEHYAEQSPATSLVGFTMADGDVPTEGAVVLDGAARPPARSTSSRYSPVLERVIGMAWVPAAAGAGRRPRSRSPTRAGTLRGRRPDQAVLRPRGRGAALVSLEFLSADAAAPARRGRAQPDGAPGAAPRARASSRATAGTWSVDYGSARAGVSRVPRAPSGGPTSRTWASSSCRATATRRDRARTGARHARARRDDAWWCPLTPDRALVIGEPAATRCPRTLTERRRRHVHTCSRR